VWIWWDSNPQTVCTLPSSGCARCLCTSSAWRPSCRRLN
jgi:hypothetical protein